MEQSNIKLNNIKSEVVLFTFQILVISIVVCVSMLNLTLQWGNQNLWTVILTASMGYIMPNPKLDVSSNKVLTEKRNTSENL